MDLIKAIYRFLFAFLERRNRVATNVLRVLERTFIACTPAFAAPYQIAESSKLLTPLSAAIFGAALVHCLVLTALMAWVSGTFFNVPGSACSVEFIEDIWNIELYLLVCPTYVTLCIRLVLLSMERDPHNLRPLTTTTAGQARRVFICLFCVYVFSALLITGYVDDALNPAIVKPSYWFIDNASGVRRLNAAGLYYIVLNFALLFLTFLGGAAFIGISIDGIRLSRELLDSGTPIDYDTYALRVERLLVAYFFGTLLVATYAVNIFIWQKSPLAPTRNIDIAAVMLTLLGVFFVAVPKQYIDYVWGRYAARRDADHGRRGLEPTAVELPRRAWTKVILGFNVAWIVTWASSYWGLERYLDPQFWLDAALTRQLPSDQSDPPPSPFSACGRQPATHKPRSNSPA